MGKFDNDEAPAKKQKELRIFRGFSKNNPKKVIVKVQDLEGVLEKHIREL